MDKSINTFFEEHNERSPRHKIKLPLEEDPLRINILSVGNIFSDLVSIQPTTSELPSTGSTALELSSVKLTTSDSSSMKSTTSDLPSIENHASDLSSRKSTTLDLTSMKFATSDLPSVKNYTSDLSIMKSTTSDLPNIDNYTSDLPSMKSDTSDLPSVKNDTSDLSLMKSTTSDLPSIENYTSELRNLQSISLKPSSEGALLDGFSKDVRVKFDLIVLPSTSNTTFPKLEGDWDKPIIKVEELLESINIQKEETEEMLDMVSRAKEKLEFFIFHVDYVVKSLQSKSNRSLSIIGRGNVYVKSMYRKKLEEFAMGLLGKIKHSIQDLEIDYATLKEQEKRTVEICEKITEFHKISYEAERVKKNLLKETVDQLAEEIFSLKSKQLPRIEKASYIETDIEMLYDLHRRFSSIEG